MKLILVGAIDPPADQRQKWARLLLNRALDESLEPVTTKGKTITKFRMTLSRNMQEKIMQDAEHSGLSIEETTAGLILAASRLPELSAPSETTSRRRAVPARRASKVKVYCDGKPFISPEAQAAMDALVIPGSVDVNPILQPSLRQLIYNSENCDISLFETAAGNAKNLLLATMVTYASSQNRQAVISCPLHVKWQVLRKLVVMTEGQAPYVSLLLDRTNFVMPEAINEWLKESPNQALQRWVKNGGPSTGIADVVSSIVLGQPLSWLLEDALQLAKDLPVDRVMLKDETESLAEQAYQKQFSCLKKASVILCSHHMLATHTKHYVQPEYSASEKLQHAKTILPIHMDTLIVDEAHLLESAFASTFTHTIYLGALFKVAKQIPGKAGKLLLTSVNKFADFCRLQNTKGSQEGFTVQPATELRTLIANVVEKLESITEKQLASLEDKEKNILSKATFAFHRALSGQDRMSINFSPAHRTPTITIGSANLKQQFEKLWENTDCATLVSPTLYGIGGIEDHKLICWKLGIPLNRVQHLEPVVPDWAAKNMQRLTTRMAIAPDDSDAWADECSNHIEEVARTAKGGTLVLCTSHLNTEQLGQRLKESLGERLIVQTSNNQSSACTHIFAEKYHQGLKPVWIGLGSTWGGTDLSDIHVPPEQDFMLTDLVITRIPMGVNRTFSHLRRVQTGGFSVVLQEAIWQLCQGISQLVRREGVKDRRLWVFDARVDSDQDWCRTVRRVIYGDSSH